MPSWGLRPITKGSSERVRTAQLAPQATPISLSELGALTMGSLGEARTRRKRGPAASRGLVTPSRRGDHVARVPRAGSHSGLGRPGRARSRPVTAGKCAVRAVSGAMRAVTGTVRRMRPAQRAGPRRPTRAKTCTCTSRSLGTDIRAKRWGRGEAND
jgi:hypothetical protein